MGYYDQYSWYNPPERDLGPQYTAPQQQQPQQQQQQGMNPGQMYQQYQAMQGAPAMTSAYSSAAANPMMPGASYSSTAAMSPVAAGDPFTTAALAQPTQGFAAAEGGALSGAGSSAGGASGAQAAGGMSAGGMAMVGGFGALIGAAMEQTRKKYDMDYGEQLRNPSRYQQKWFGDEGINTADIIGGGMGDSASGMLDSVFDLHSLDFSNAWESFEDNDPLWKGLRSLF